MTEEEDKYRVEISDYIPNSQPLIRIFDEMPMYLLIFWLNKMESKDKIIIEKI